MDKIANRTTLATLNEKEHGLDAQKRIEAMREA
jgi:hypothetical protein